MKRFSGKLFALLFAVLILMPFGTVFAEESGPDISSPYAVIYNLKFDTVLFEQGMDQPIYPASFTKLMTALLAFEYNKSNPDTVVTVTEEMLSGISGTTMKLKVGEEIPFSGLLGGLTVNHSNDAAFVIACTVGKTATKFVDMMNERAKELGMEDTYYSNPTGIDSSVQHTTIRDTLTLCRALYRNNDFMTMSSMDKVTIPATNLTEEREYSNKNLLISYSYVYDYYIKNSKGMISGGTAEAGYCVASTLEGKDGVMIAIVSGGEDTSEMQNGTAVQSYYDAKKLFDWAAAEYDSVLVAKKDDIICEKKVYLGSNQDHVILAVKDDVMLLLPKEISKYKDKYEMHIKTSGDSLTAPIAKGQDYGTVEFTYSGIVLGEATLTALTNVARSPVLVVFNAIETFFSHGIPKIILILAIIAVAVYILSLVITVMVHSARKNKEKNRAMAKLEAAENERLELVIQKEKEKRRKIRHHFFRSMRDGFRALSGDEEIIGRDYASTRPEKYRRVQKTGQSQAQIKRPMPKKNSVNSQQNKKTPKSRPNSNINNFGNR